MSTLNESIVEDAALKSSEGPGRCHSQEPGWTLLKPIASRSSCKRLGKQPAKLETQVRLQLADKRHGFELVA